jgi:hypothetical protein
MLVSVIIATCLLVFMIGFTLMRDHHVSPKKQIAKIKGHKHHKQWKSFASGHCELDQELQQEWQRLNG